VVDERDQIAAVRTHQRPRKWLAVVGLVLIAMFLLVLASSVYRLVVHGAEPLATGILAFCGFYLAVWFLVIQPRRVRRLFRQTVGAGEPVVFEIDPQSLGLRSNRGASKILWTELHKWKEGGSHLLVYLNDGFYLILPKRFLTTEQLEALKSYLSANLPRAR